MAQRNQFWKAATGTICQRRDWAAEGEPGGREGEGGGGAAVGGGGSETGRDRARMTCGMCKSRLPLPSPAICSGQVGMAAEKADKANSLAPLRERGRRYYSTLTFGKWPSLITRASPGPAWPLLKLQPVSMPVGLHRVTSERKEKLFSWPCRNFCPTQRQPHSDLSTQPENRHPAP